MKLVLLLCLITAFSFSQNAVSHLIKMSNLSHHEITIETTFPDLTENSLNVVMSRTSPGRYALHEFAKNVYSVSFENSDGDKLEFTRPNLHEWIVANHDGEVKMTYTLFGDRADGTYSGIDETHLHLNIPSAFVWARGLENRKVEVSFPEMIDKEWKYAGQLQQKDETTFEAKDLYYFLDSPIEISKHDIRSWDINGQKIEIAAHTNDSKKRIDEYAKMGEAVTLEQAAIFGELPKFDYGKYTFLADYLPHVNGDGMEHRNSTILSSTGNLKKPLRVLGTLSHEFFHAWNVERIRPTSLEPFNFEDANVSGELWFAEGFTNYFDHLFIKRADLYSMEDFLARLNYPINKWVNGPGSGYYSAVNMSKQAPFVDAAKSVDPQNKPNTFISYYTFGEAIGIYLDLELRSKFTGKSLDGFMKSVWIKHGKSESTYTNIDIMNVLTEYTNKEYAESFFKMYVFGQEIPNYKPVLAKFGLDLRLKNSDKAYFGSVRFSEKNTTIKISSTLIKNTPLYNSGLEKGDEIISINKKDITSKDQINSILSESSVGDKLSIKYNQRGKEKTTTVTFIQDPRLEVVTFKKSGKNTTNQMRSLRAQWLSAKSEKSTHLIAKKCTNCKRTFPYFHKNCYLHGKTLEAYIK